MHSQISLSTPIAERETFNNLPKIPEDLQQYLIVVEKPQEIYHCVDRERDRRVRLLLRRFTNQIQYGCNNSFCGVPTCLSYRKRTATGPLRPHTDLSARALAIKCVEQYTTHGRDTSRSSLREKGRKKHGSLETDGLCWNEPVIPWYTDPNDYLARKSPGARRRSFPAVKSSKSVLLDPTTVHLKGDSRDGSANGSVLSNNVQSDQYIAQVKEHNHALSQIEEKDTSSTPSQLSDHSDLRRDRYSNGHVATPTIVASDAEPTKHDQASLTQSLLKHPKIQDLSALATESNQLPTDKILAQQESLPLTSTNSESRSSNPAIKVPYPGHRVATFRILPLSAVEWFKVAFSESNRSDSQSRAHLSSFLDQCLHYVLTNPYRLQQSVSTWSRYEQRNCADSRTNKIDSHNYDLPNFNDVIESCHTLAQCFSDSDLRFRIAPFLMQVLQYCYQLPQHIKPSKATSMGHTFLPNPEAARTILLVMNLIAAAKPPSSAITRTTTPGHASDQKISNFKDAVHSMAGMGTTRLPLARNNNAESSALAVLAFSRYQLDVLPLCESIADIISHRIALDRATTALQGRPANAYHNRGIINEVLEFMQSAMNQPNESRSNTYRAMQMLDYMQIVVYMKWDRMPIVRRTSPVGGALEVLKALFIRKGDLGLSESWFTMTSISAALNEVETPFEWLSFRPDGTKMHILQFSFLFPSKMIVRYFRSLNLKIMKHSHEKAMAIHSNGRQQLLNGPWQVTNVDSILDATRPHMARYFVMTIRRSNLLEDAIGQIWHRERQELTRPLKVILGQDEGEDGLDHGGVQQEFFRLVFAEVFDPKYAMFDTDPTTHMTWFKPSSMEPLYKYEAIGILMSLAVYNGVTIPINMPLAFYRKILGFKVKQIEHIEDGWPEIAKSFKQLLAWDQGDVEDVMSLDYEFSYEAFGKTITIDMTKDMPKQQKSTNSHKKSKGKGKAVDCSQQELSHPNASNRDCSSNGSAVDESTDKPRVPPVPVTNKNRNEFVRTYISYLTDKTIEHQFTSFLRGLHTLLSPTALSLFAPSHLKLLFEGQPSSEPLSINAWRSNTKYEDFEPDHSIVTWFWEVLEHDMTQDQLRKLLEFVTANSRLPVGGWEGVTFLVQRNGTGDDRLPGSSTCYGRLLLPEYSCKEVLRERLIKAVEEGFGFGMI